MRIRHLALWATGSVLIGVALTAALPAGASVAGSIVVDKCIGTVQGSPGQRVALEPVAVLQPITDALAPLDPLGVLRWQLSATWTTLPPIPIGAVSAGHAPISGTAIGDSVVSRLGSVPAVSPVLGLLSGPVAAALTDICGVATEPAPQTGLPAPKPPAGPGGSPQSPGGTPTASSGPDASHGSGVTGGVAPGGVAHHLGAGNDVPDRGVPPEGVITLSIQPPPPYILPGLPGVPGLPAESGVTQDNAATPQPGQGSVAGDSGTAHLLNAGKVASNERRLLPAFAVLLLALVLSQSVRSWALRSSRRRLGPGAQPVS